MAAGEEDDITLRERDDDNKKLEIGNELVTFLSKQTTHSADWNVSIGGALGTSSSAGALGRLSSISPGGALASPDIPFVVPLIFSCSI